MLTHNPNLTHGDGIEDALTVQRLSRGPMSSVKLHLLPFLQCGVQNRTRQPYGPISWRFTCRRRQGAQRDLTGAAVMVPEEQTVKLLHKQNLDDVYIPTVPSECGGGGTGYTDTGSKQTPGRRKGNNKMNLDK